MSKEEQKQKEEIILEEEEIDFLAADKMKKLKEELRRCRKEKEEYLTGWQRAKADFINARKEEEKNRENFLKLAEKNLILELLSVLESFEALTAGEKLLFLDKEWQDGVKNIQGQLMKILQDRGLSIIQAQGKPFDPQEHESIEEVAVDDENKDHLVLEEISQGYKLHDLVLRPTRVKVGIYKQ